ncbi:glycoside hydrolase [Seiridium cupressi]
MDAHLVAISDVRDSPFRSHRTSSEAEVTGRINHCPSYYPRLRHDATAIGWANRYRKGQKAEPQRRSSSPVLASYVLHSSYGLPSYIMRGFHIHVIAFYRDVEIQQYEARVNDPLNPDARLANGSTGMDLILYYIRKSFSFPASAVTVSTNTKEEFYCYQVMSLLILWWASELAQSVYGLVQKRSTRKRLRRVNAAGKIIAIIFPFIIILVLRTPPVQRSPLIFTVITDIPLGLAMGVGSILMLVILGRYIYSRRKLLSFDAGQGASTDPESQNSSNAGSRYSRFTKPRRRKAIYDRWLMTRFSIAFVFLCIFQATATLFQQLSIGNFEQRLSIPQPDFSSEKAQKTFLLFIPGNLPGIGLFLVFGTTAAFRKHIHETYSDIIRWIKIKRNPEIQEPLQTNFPLNRMGYQPHIYSTGPNLMKALPHRPGSRMDGEDDAREFQPAEKAIVHDRNSIYVMRTLSVERTSRPAEQRMPTDSSQDSTPSLLIMRQSTEDRR